MRKGQEPILREQDIICEAVYIFDHAVRLKEFIMLKVADLDQPTVDALMAVFAEHVSDTNGTATASAAAMTAATAATALQQAGKGHVFDAVTRYINVLVGVEPGGATSFVPPCEALVADFAKTIEQQARDLVPCLGFAKAELLQTTYVQFDTGDLCVKFC